MKTCRENCTNIPGTLPEGPSMFLSYRLQKLATKALFPIIGKDM
jgi:hypothetical protein